MKLFAKNRAFKHNKTMKMWAKWIVGILTVIGIITIAIAQPSLADNGQPDSAISDHASLTSSEYQEYLECKRKLVATNSQISDLEVEEKCKRSIPTKCNVEGTAGYIICPFIKLLGVGVDSSYHFISDFFKLDVQFFSSDNPAYEIWQQVRNLANSGLVIAFLVIIASQLTNIGISNYNIKKTLPKLIMTAILLNSSFFISQFLIDLSNILGQSIVSLFDGIGNAVFLRNQVTNEPSALGATSALMVVMGIMTISSQYIRSALYSLILPMLASFVLVVVTTGILLLVRQATAIVLVVISPLAFLSLILPNTERLFKMWKKVIYGVLILFPVVGFLFGAAGFVSNLLVQSSDSFLMQTLGLIMTGMPLVFTPALVKSTIAAIPMIGGKVSGAIANYQNKANQTVKNSRSVQFSKNRRQLALDNIKSNSTLKNRFNYLDRGLGRVAGIWNTHTQSGLNRLQEVDSRRNQAINSLASGLSLRDSQLIEDAAKNNSLESLDFSKLSLESRQSLAANGFGKNNIGELAAAAYLKQAQKGDLTDTGVTSLLGYAANNGVSQANLAQINEEARKRSMEKGNYTAASISKALAEAPGGITGQTTSNLQNDQAAQKAAITKILSSLDSSQIAKTSHKFTSNSNQGSAAFKDLYDSSASFKYVVDASFKDPNMTAATNISINQAIR